MRRTHVASPQERPEERRPKQPVAQPHALLALQRSAGNQAVARMLARQGGDKKKGQAKPQGKVMTMSELLKREGAGGSAKTTKTAQNVSGNVVTLTEVMEAEEPSQTASKPPDSSAPAPLTAEAVTPELIDAYREDMESGNAWGGDAEIAQLAEAGDATVHVIHQSDDGFYMFTIGSGAHHIYLLHNGTHYDAVIVEGDSFRIVRIARNGSCLFLAFWKALTGQDADDEILQLLREYVSLGLTDEQIINTLVSGNLTGMGPQVAAMLSMMSPASGPLPAVQTPPIEVRREQAAHAAEERLGIPHPQVVTPPIEVRREQAAAAAERRRTQPQVVDDRTPAKLDMTNPIETQRDQRASAAERRLGIVRPEPKQPTPEERRRQAAAAMDKRLGTAPPPLPQLAPPPTVTGAHADALADFRRAKEQAFAEYAKSQPQPLPQLLPQPTVTGAHADALKDYRAAQQAALIAYGNRPKPKPSPAVVAPPVVPPAVAAPAPVVFDAAAAADIVADQPPQPGQKFEQYLATLDVDALEVASYDYSSAHVALIRQAFNAHLERAAREAAEREANFDPEDASTWTLNAVQFFNGVTEGAVLTAVDGAAVLAAIANGTVRVNKKGGHTEISVNQGFHCHLQTASWGLAVIFILEDDFTVTPWVFDIAYSRSDNKYNWENGGRKQYDSNARQPRKRG